MSLVRTVVMLACAASLACRPAEAPAPAAALVAAGEAWTVRSDGIGPVVIGMDLSAVRSALRAPAARLVGNEPDPAMVGCSYLADAGLPDGVGVMFDGARVARVEVRAGTAIRTVERVGIGSSEADVQAAYRGRVTTEPHKYVPEGHYLVVVPNHGAAPGDILFETDGQRVTSYRAGTRDAVALVEGCS